MSTVDTFGSKGTLEVSGKSYEIFRLNTVEGVERLPYSLKILAENLLRRNGLYADMWARQQSEREEEEEAEAAE